MVHMTPIDNQQTKQQAWKTFENFNPGTSRTLQTVDKESEVFQWSMFSKLLDFDLKSSVALSTSGILNPEAFSVSRDQTRSLSLTGEKWTLTPMHV